MPLFFKDLVTKDIGVIVISSAIDTLSTIPHPPPILHLAPIIVLPAIDVLAPIIVSSPISQL